jgi:hypothetical protein
MDAYSAFDARELANERTIDLNRENAAESDGITPANVPVWTRLRVERMDGSTDLNATCNALCAHICTLDEAAIEVVKLRDRCQILELQKEEIRHTYQRHLGAYTRLAIDAMHDALAAGVIPEKLANDLNELRRAA